MYICIYMKLELNLVVRFSGARLPTDTTWFLPPSRTPPEPFPLSELVKASCFTEIPKPRTRYPESRTRNPDPGSRTPQP